jgi:hypothetical protein
VRGSSDVQNNNIVFITLKPSDSVLKASNASEISKDNLIENAIFLSVRKTIEKTWINDRDQFLYPNDGWKNDTEFQNNCLAFALFENNIQSQFGINHWIPFTEDEVKAREKFASNFMSKFISGKLKTEKSADLFGAKDKRTTPLIFSAEAQAVFDAGRELYTCYHQQPKCNVNASLYDIREYFQGRNEAGRMNSTSDDEAYSFLIKDLRDKLKILQKTIEPKIYAYEFLK